MLRIISGLLLLIISQFAFASTSTSTETISATSALVYKYSSSINYSTCAASLGSDANQAVAMAKSCDGLSSVINTSCNPDSTNYTFVQSEAGSCVYHGYTKSGHVFAYNVFADKVLTFYGNSYSCLSGYTLSGTNCTKEITVDSCTSQAGQSALFWVSKKSAPATICSGTCLANISGSWGDLPDADPDSYTQHQYTYTGATGECTSDTGFTDDATASAANESAAERERLAKIQQAISDAKAACGGRNLS